MPAIAPLADWERRLLRWCIGMWAEPQMDWPQVGALCSWKGRSLEEPRWQPSEEAVDALLAALPWDWGLLPYGVEPWPKGLLPPESLPPPLLCHRGRQTQLLGWERISLLGTTRPDAAEVQRTKRLVGLLAQRPGAVLVTGLGAGVEAVALRHMLQLGGPVLVVAPGPLDRLRPQQEAWVAEVVAQGGLAVSPWPFGAQALGDAWTWQQRVRGALASMSIVVAAQSQSAAVRQAALVRAVKGRLWLCRQLVPQPPDWVQEALKGGARVLELREPAPPRGRPFG